MGRIWFIRHGQTSFNVTSGLWHKAGDPPEGAGFQYTEEYIDPGLTQNGFSQIEANKQQILALPIDIVYVSPMLRTLETCDIIYRNHENRPHIIVQPLFTEWLHVNHDIPIYPNDYKQRFDYFDWSFFGNEYFIKSIIKNHYTEMINDDNPTLSLLQIIKNASPEVVESRRELYERTLKGKELLRIAAGEKNVAVIGHSAFYRHFTSKMNENGEFVGQKLLSNGEFSEILFED